MSGNPPAHNPPTRVSARIEARQINDTPAWITPTTTNGEKSLLLAVLDHLHDLADCLAVLHYLTKAFHPIAATLHFVPTIRKAFENWRLHMISDTTGHNKSGNTGMTSRTQNCWNGRKSK